MQVGVWAGDSLRANGTKEEDSQAIHPTSSDSKEKSRSMVKKREMD